MRRSRDRCNPFEIWIAAGFIPLVAVLFCDLSLALGDSSQAGSEDSFSSSSVQASPGVRPGGAVKSQSPPIIETLERDRTFRPLKPVGESNTVIYALYKSMVEGKTVKLKWLGTTDEGDPVVTYIIAVNKSFELIFDNRKDKWSGRPGVSVSRSKTLSLQVRLPDHRVIPLGNLNPRSLPKDHTLKLCFEIQSDESKNIASGTSCYP